RLLFLKTLCADHDAFLSLVLAHFVEDGEVVRDMLDFILRRKMIGAEASSALQQAIRGDRHPHLRPALDKLTTLHRQIVKKKLDGPGPDGLAAHEQRLEQWSDETNRLQTE